MNAEKAALSYLHTFTQDVREDGEELRRSGAVKEIFGNYQSFQTRVRIGAQLYQCSFRLHDTRWVGAMNGRSDTTAPLAASMMEYLHRAGELPAAPANQDEETLDDVVEKKTGRKLEPRETDFLGKIEGRYAKWLQKGDLVDHDLVRLHPRWPVEGYEPISLWPANEPPQDLQQFWNYVAYALAKKNLSWPPFISAITDLDATREKFSAWESQADLEKWRERTSRLTFGEETGSSRPAVFRLKVTPREARPQVQIGGTSSPFRPLDFVTMREQDDRDELEFDTASALLWARIRDHWKFAESQDLRFERIENRRLLAKLFSQPALVDRLVTIDDEPFQRSSEPLRWTCQAPVGEGDPYLLQLTAAGGEPISHSLTVLPGRETLYLSDDVIFHGPRPWLETAEMEPRHELPAEVVETSQGVDFLLRIGAELPPALAARVVGARMTANVLLRLSDRKFSTDTEYLFASVTATDPARGRREVLTGSDWEIEAEPSAERGQIVRYEREVLRHFPALLDPLNLVWDPANRRFRVKLTKTFPDKFFAWVSSLPEGVGASMDDTLASVMADPLKASVRFDVQPAADQGAIDWFDLKVVLEIPGSNLSNDDLRLLVEARGGFVRLSDGLWHRLDMNLPEEQRSAVAELGLDLFDLTGERHRLHVLQLSSPAARDIFDLATWNRLCDRASALKLSVRPAPPDDLRANLRPYQIEGFHFLAYLAANRFGGILADDMGLGKTVQALCWLLWLRRKMREIDRAAAVAAADSPGDNGSTPSAAGSNG